MKKILLFGLIFCLVKLSAQQTENNFSNTLENTLRIVAEKFDIKFEYHPASLKAKVLTYANWRLREDLPQTLDNTIRSLDLIYTKKPGTNVYIINKFRYHIRTEEEGKKHLALLLTKYKNASAFDLRKKELSISIAKAMGIDLMKVRETPVVVRGSKRLMDGYSVENIAIETFPGYYLCGSLYSPLIVTGKIPAILSPHGHFPDYRAEDPSLQGRYNPNVQTRCAALAKMGSFAYSYDMYSWGESMLHTNDTSAHGNGVANAIQTWNSIRVVDFLASLENVDTKRIGVTGASGGGTQTMLVAALDKRISLSVPVVMLSSSFYGGCECESGLPIHHCVPNYTNNAEIGAMIAPNPLLVISNGSDWTTSVPNTDYPYLKKVFSLYGKPQNVESVYLPKDQHDYGFSKREPMYHFIAKHFSLNIANIKNRTGKIDETSITIESPEALAVFTNQVQFPKSALKGHEAIAKAFKKYHQLDEHFINY
jgi:dienelactone hydrolase